MNKHEKSPGWLSLSKEEVYKSTVFSLMKERSRCLRTGAENDFYYFKCVNWINVIAVTESSELLMIRQYRHGSGQTELEIPGGAIDASDTDPLEAGTRELFEETGCSGTPVGIIGRVCPNPALQGNICHTALIRDVKKIADPRMESTEDIESFFIPHSEVRKKIKDGEIRHGLVLNALHFYELYLEQTDKY
jgi:8-oxo-dGTP pyrophosphatase MutT (NUDIX family)